MLSYHTQLWPYLRKWITRFCRKETCPSEQNQTLQKMKRQPDSAQLSRQAGPLRTRPPTPWGTSELRRDTPGAGRWERTPNTPGGEADRHLTFEVRGNLFWSIKCKFRISHELGPHRHVALKSFCCFVVNNIL